MTSTAYVFQQASGVVPVYLPTYYYTTTQSKLLFMAMIMITMAYQYQTSIESTTG